MFLKTDPIPLFGGRPHVVRFSSLDLYVASYANVLLGRHAIFP